MGDQTIPESKTQKMRFLKRYVKNKECIERLEDKLVALDERIKTIKSPNLSGMPRGGIPVSIDDLLSDKLDLENRIDRLKAKGRALKREILEAIDLLEDPRYCEVLEARFIDGLTFDEIAEETGYTERHIYTLYAEAISSISVYNQ